MKPYAPATPAIQDMIDILHAMRAGAVTRQELIHELPGLDAYALHKAMQRILTAELARTIGAGDTATMLYVITEAGLAIIKRRPDRDQIETN